MWVTHLSSVTEARSPPDGVPEANIDAWHFPGGKQQCQQQVDLLRVSAAFDNVLWRS